MFTFCFKPFLQLLSKKSIYHFNVTCLIWIVLNLFLIIPVKEMQKFWYTLIHRKMQEMLT